MQNNRILAFLLLCIASSLWAGNFFTPLPASRSYSGVFGVPTATVVSDSNLVLSYGYWYGERRWGGIQSIGPWLELGGMIAGQPGASGDLSLQARFALPVWQCQKIRLNLGAGGSDIGGGAVAERYFYGVASLEVPYARLSVGAWDKPDSLLFASVEVQPISFFRLLWTPEQSGFALVAPRWAAFQVGYDKKGNQKSFSLSITRPLDSLTPRSVPRDSTSWNIHYQPIPDLFDVVAVETGIYHYQFMVQHRFSFFWKRHWGASAQVRQPIAHSQELNNSKSLAQYRKDGVAVQQSTLYWNAEWKEFRSQIAVGNYEDDWWYWRSQLGWKAGSFWAQVGLTRFDNPRIAEYRVVCVPQVGWEFIPKRYELQLFGGSFWEQDYGGGMSLLKKTGHVNIAFSAIRTYPVHLDKPVHIIGASLSLPLRFPKDIAIGNRHFTMNGPDEWNYGLRTRLVKPGETNAVNPKLADFAL